MKVFQGAWMRGVGEAVGQEGSDRRKRRISYLSAMALRMHDPRQPRGVLAGVKKECRGSFEVMFGSWVACF